MAANSISFDPGGSLRALLNLIYAGKHSRNVPLVVVLLSAVYAVYRSIHWLRNAFSMPLEVAIPTAIFIEALVIGASALVFIAFRERFVAELKDEDETIAQAGVYLSLTLIAIAFVTLLSIAWADAMLMTGEALPSVIMTLAQAAQAGFIVAFLISALLDERGRLREQYADFERRVCQFCKLPVTPNNKARHEDKCSKNPKNMPAP